MGAAHRERAGEPAGEDGLVNFWRLIYASHALSALGYALVLRGDAFGAASCFTLALVLTGAATYIEWIRPPK